MKKFLLVFVVLFALLVFAGCEKLDSLEWEVLPKSVFVVGEEYDLDSNVKININGNPYTLEEAKATFQDELTITGFDTSNEGLGTLIIKYKTLSLYWAYQVIKKTTDLPEEDEYKPSYGWFDPNKEEYVLETPEDLYGFANIVNGRDEKTAFDFAGKTVKLDADIDLTGKVWVPIGEGVRKQVQEVEFADFQTKITRFSGVADEDDLKNRLNNHETDKNKEFEGCVYLGNYYFAQKVGSEWKYFYSESGGVTGNFFAGTFDGQGHKIIGLSDIGYTPNSIIYANVSRVIKAYTFGLFGIVSGDVTVKNLNFENIQIVGAYYDADEKELVLAEIDSVGAAIGYAFGEGDVVVENVKVLSGFITGEDGVGGVVGRVYSKGNMMFKNLQNRANVTSNGHAGGIVGYVSLKGAEAESDVKFDVKFLDDYNYGNIISTSKEGGKAAGAMINYVDQANKDYVDVEMKGCYNFGNIFGMYSGNSTLGLHSGYRAQSNYNITDDCYNYGVLKLRGE
ncbi:MAG TPA: hypothetical protein GX692_01080 [Acholeplasmataceae bacterium]|nr:hypothetical protein [Acholeplasmataceae bacterium]